MDTRIRQDAHPSLHCIAYKVATSVFTKYEYSLLLLFVRFFFSYLLFGRLIFLFLISPNKFLYAYGIRMFMHYVVNRNAKLIKFAINGVKVRKNSMITCRHTKNNP